MEDLSPIASVSGRGPVFDEALLAMARRLARRYVHPVSTILSLFTPPRLQRGAFESPALPLVPPLTPQITVMRPSLRDDIVERYVAEISAGLDKGKGTIVAVPEVREGSRVLESLAAKFPDDTAIVHSGLDDAERSRNIWNVAAGKAKVVLGGRASLFVPPFDLAKIIIHDEDDRSFRDQRTPYYDAREVAIERARVTGASVLLVSSTPSLTSIHESSWELEEPDRTTERAAWPIVEVVKPPRTGMARRAIAAIIETRRRGQQSLVLLPRAHSTKAGLGPEAVAAFLERVVPGARISRADRPGLGQRPGALVEALKADVIVATEAALAEVQRPPVSLAVALGVDTYFQRPSVSAAEDTFGLLYGLATLVAGIVPKGRLVVETESSDHHVVQALVRGDYRYFASHELEVRKESSNPPFVSLVRLRTNSARHFDFRGSAASGAQDSVLRGAATPPNPPSFFRGSAASGAQDSVLRGAATPPNPPTLEGKDLMEQLRGLPGVEVLGPIEAEGGGAEILLKVIDLETILDQLGSIVSLRKGDIHVEMDPRQW